LEPDEPAQFRAIELTIGAGPAGSISARSNGPAGRSSRGKSMAGKISSSGEVDEWFKSHAWKAWVRWKADKADDSPGSPLYLRAIEADRIAVHRAVTAGSTTGHPVNVRLDAGLVW